MSRQVIWRGTTNGEDRVRVVKVSENDLLAEELAVRSDDPRFLSVDRCAYSVDSEGAWAATDDETARQAYQAAVLEAHHVLERIKTLAAFDSGLPVCNERWSKDLAAPDPSEDDLMDPHIASAIRQAVKVAGMWEDPDYRKKTSDAIKKVLRFLSREPPKT